MVWLYYNTQDTKCLSTSENVHGNEENVHRNSCFTTMTDSQHSVTTKELLSEGRGAILNESHLIWTHRGEVALSSVH